MKTRMATITNIALSATLAVATAGACGTDGERAPLSDRVQHLQVDLAMGSQGDDVRTLHDYLTLFGYYPNPTLSQKYPRWRPIVDRSPSIADAFDDDTETAVRQLQLNASLPQTGLVDQATRDLMRTRRCGVPDGIIPLDATDKFALLNNISAASLNWTWYLTSSDDQVTVAQAQMALSNAAATWSGQSSLSFSFGVPTITGSPPNVVVDFENLNSPLTLGETGNGGSAEPEMTLNTQVDWTVSVPPSAGFVDMQSVFLHEMGHALGLAHSAFSAAVMYPYLASSNFDRTLDTDDDVGISTLWDTYRQLPGGATDIGAGADGSVWIIGTSATSGGFNIFKFNGNGWDMDYLDGGAVRIAVGPTGVPFIINSSNQIFERTTNSPFAGFWQQLPGAGTDIGVGADGSVWVLGVTPRNGGFPIFKFNGTGWDADAAGGGAVRIAVSPSGVPWIVSSTNNIYRRTTNTPFSGTWQALPGNMVDIGVGPGSTGADGSIWSVNGTGNTVYVWDEQTGSGSGGSGIPSTQAWRVGGDNRGIIPGFNAGSLPAKAISVGAFGKPWIVGTGGGIFTSVR
jgi:hypothetical protein